MPCMSRFTSSTESEWVLTGRDILEVGWHEHPMHRLKTLDKYLQTDF